MYSHRFTINIFVFKLENPFGNRMDMEQLPEYIETLSWLKEKYQNRIDIEIGLEVEYLPSYKPYYQELKNKEAIDCLMIGQYFFETKQDEYSLDFNNKKDEYIGLANAVIEGMQTGLFIVVAHPDRIFRREIKWDHRLEQTARQVIDTASGSGVILEVNLSLVQKRNNYWIEFWNIVPEGIKTIIGVDAYSVSELLIPCNHG